MSAQSLAPLSHRRWAWQRTAASLALLLSLVLALTAWAAAPAALVTDLNPQRYQAGSSGPVIKPAPYSGFAEYPYSPAAMGGALFFAAWDEANGTELWSLDRISGVYALVKDINPGPASSSPHDLIDLNGRLLFAADDGSYGDELWSSDGTASGTWRVKDTVPGAARLVGLTNASGTLFFMVQLTPEVPDTYLIGAPESWELWKSDGTPTGTVLVRADFPGFNPTKLLSIGGTVFFTAWTADYGIELWNSDGTEAGTLLVKDISPGADSSYPYELTNVNGTVFFSATDSAHGIELWRSDGTEAGTALVKDIFPGSTGASPNNLTAVNSTVFFSANDGASGNELWKSDGSADSTQLVKDITPGPVGASPQNLTQVGGALVFIAGGDVNYRLIWKSDGSAGGTELIMVLSPSDGTLLGAFTAANDTLFFSTSRLFGEYRLWKSDGTPAGTQAFASLPGPIMNPANLGGQLFFSVWSTIGYDLWKSDGTPAGTLAVKPAMPSQGSSEIFQPIALHSDLFFMLNRGTDRELWKSDGTPAGSMLVKAGVMNGPTRVGQKILFSVNNPAGSELWASDGTTAGTARIMVFPEGSIASVGWGSVNARLFFGLYTGNLLGGATEELWASDGTPDGTTHVIDMIANDTPGLSIGDFTNVNGTLFFSVVMTWIYNPCNDEPADRTSAITSAASSTSRYALWKSDGTPAGTKLVKRFGCSYWGAGAGSTPPALADLTNVQGTLFFAAQEAGAASKTALWKSDGTPAGTVKLAAVVPTQLTALDRTLFFTANDGIHGTEVWKSDGTPAGTFLLKDILPGALTSSPSQLTAVDQRLFFSASDGSHGAELWSSDGTPSGTVLVDDIWPGPEGSAPAELAGVNGTLAFSASDGAAGYEPWHSDGSAEGTALIQDIAPGAANSNPAQLTFAATQLFFTANDGVVGREPWAIRALGSTIPSGGGRLSAWMDRTTYSFAPAAFSTTAIVTHTMRAPDRLPATSDRIQIGHAFEVAAVDSATGQALAPARQFSITIRYTDAERGPAIADTLALYFWDGNRWVQEPTSGVNPSAHTITATPGRVGLWAVLGETRRSFLPVARR